MKPSWSITLLFTAIALILSVTAFAWLVSTEVTLSLGLSLCCVLLLGYVLGSWHRGVQLQRQLTRLEKRLFGYLADMNETAKTDRKEMSQTVQMLYEIAQDLFKLMRRFTAPSSQQSEYCPMCGAPQPESEKLRHFPEHHNLGCPVPQAHQLIDRLRALFDA